MSNKIILFFLSLLLFAENSRAADTEIYRIQSGNEYYIYHPYYGRLLGPKADGTAPALSRPGTQNNADSYRFVAESASTASGAFYLKQKSSGKYFAASTSNSYSVVFQSTKGTQNVYLWRLTPGMRDGRISSCKSPVLRLGCDSGKDNDAYVGVYYDKDAGELSDWRIFRADGTFEEAYRAYCLAELQNAIDDSRAETSHTSNPLKLRSQLQKGIAAAEQVYAHPEDSTAEQLAGVVNGLRDLLIQCSSYGARTLLTTDFEVGDAYTLALNNVLFRTPTDSVTMIVRTAKGDGIAVTLSQTAVTADGKRFEVEPGGADGSDYLFACSGSSMSIYKDKKLVTVVPVYAVPAYTSVGTGSEWAILRHSNLTSYSPELVNASKAVTEYEEQTDRYGNKVRYVVSLNNRTLTLSAPIDFHIMSEQTPLQNTVIDLTDEKAWVIFDNTLPSEVVEKYLGAFRVDGQAAVIDRNIRVGVYLNGAVVMPYSTTVKPFTGYSGEAYAGDAVAVGLGASDLGKNSNLFRSFILKRGYMATVASGSKGSGYSRVYVADHHDLLVPVLPDALNRRISSVHVKKWNYVSKKGWCSTTGNSAIATECRKVRATWFYTWSADRSSTYNTEYIPIRQHLYWPSMNQINGQTASTHVLSFNEPEHAEQHTSSQCSCGGVISEWNACTKTPDFAESGMRIGSPAPTDAGWLYNYIGHCDDMSYRCDFVVMHCYWGTNEAANAAAWYSRLKTIYQKTRRPIWITEWNNGASWTTESWPSGYGDKLEKNRKAIKEILNVLDTCSFVERYAIYNWDSYYRAMINTDDGSLTPAGQVYRDNKSTFAYNADVQFVPIWWAPSLKDVKLTTKLNSATGKVVFTIDNPNGDVTDRLTIQRRTAGGAFEEYYTEKDRSKFDATSYTYSFDMAEFDTDADEFRVWLTTTLGKATYSNVTSLSYIANPNIQTETKDAVEGWTCLRSASAGFTKATGDTYLEVWNATAQDMNFDYYQEIDDLADGIYELSAACFNTTDKVAGATVNGHVGLYAQADGLEYFAPVTEDAELNPSVRQSIPFIAVTGGRLRIGIKNIGRMSARWAGADEFRLRYLGTADEVLPQGPEAFADEIARTSDARYMALFAWNADSTEADASEVIVNADCTRKDTYGWAAEGIDYSTGEAYDGVSANPYWNRWSATAFTSSMSQQLDYLPPGEYTVGALMRGSTAMKMELTATVTDNGTTAAEYSQSVQGTGVDVSAGNPLPKGWQAITLPGISLRRGEKLTMGMHAVNDGGGNWWSVDHFTLTYRPAAADAIRTPYVPVSELTVRGGKGQVELTTARPVAITICTLNGAVVASRYLPAGTTRLPLKRGLYLVNRRKVHVR